MSSNIWKASLIFSVLSSSLYTKYISPNFSFVTSTNNSKVDFANAYQLLYGETEGIATDNKESMKSVERFAIYYLIDFAAKLFSGSYAKQK